MKSIYSNTLQSTDEHSNQPGFTSIGTLRILLHVVLLISSTGIDLNILQFDTYFVIRTRKCKIKTS